MSAHTGAPGFRRPQMATPTFSPPTEFPAAPVAPRGPGLRRKALAVAVATLCAPALAGTALAAIGATGGGDRPAMASFEGAQGLRGSTTPGPASATPNSQPVRLAAAKEPIAEPVSKPTSVAPSSPQTQPTPTHAPPRQTAPSPPRRVQPTPQTRSPSPPTSPVDPTGPGAPIDPTTTGPGTTGGTTTSSSGTSTSGGGTSGGDVERRNAYPGGG